VDRVEILKRGSAVDVEHLRRQLRLGAAKGGTGKGDEASLLLTKAAGHPVVVIARRLGA
jgi:hypothetical protein